MRGKTAKLRVRLAGAVIVGIVRTAVAASALLAPLNVWGQAGGPPPPAPDGRGELQRAIAAKDYGRAAELMSGLIRDGGYPHDQLRDRWMDVGKFYYSAKRYQEGYIAFWAAACWFPNRDQARACGLALTCLEAERKESKGTAAEAFIKTVIERARRDIAGLITLGSMPSRDDGKTKRARGLYEEALADFRKIAPDTKFYAEALFETAQTRRAMAEKAYNEAKGSESAKAAANACADAFDALDAYYRKRLPALGTDEGKADERKRLIQTATIGLDARCGALLDESINQPAKVLELTAPGFEKKYPNIETMDNPPAYGLALFYRLRAAYQLTRSDPDHAGPYLLVIEPTWKTLCETNKDFAYLDKAAATCAGAYAVFADRQVAGGLPHEPGNLGESGGVIRLVC